MTNSRVVSRTDKEQTGDPGVGVISMIQSTDGSCLNV